MANDITVVGYSSTTDVLDNGGLMLQLNYSIAIEDQETLQAAKLDAEYLRDLINAAVEEIVSDYATDGQEVGLVDFKEQSAQLTLVE